MMTIERRTEEPRISIVTRSGVVNRSDNPDEKKESKSTGVRKTVEKVPNFDIQKEIEVFREEERSFMDVGALTSSA